MKGSMEMDSLTRAIVEFVRSADFATISPRALHTGVLNYLRASSLTGYMPMSWPPQTLIACPVMKSASVEHRNATALA